MIMYEYTQLTSQEKLGIINTRIASKETLIYQFELSILEANNPTGINEETGLPMEVDLVYIAKCEEAVEGLRTIISVLQAVAAELDI
jgi:hypothetical protein